MKIFFFLFHFFVCDFFFKRSLNMIPLKCMYIHKDEKDQKLVSSTWSSSYFHFVFFAIFCDQAWIYDNNSYDVSKSNSHTIRRAVALSICQRIPTRDQCSYQFVTRSLVRKIIHISLFWNSIRFHATRKKAVLSNDTRWKLILLHFISFILLQKMRWFMIQYNWIRRIKILCLQMTY